MAKLTRRNTIIGLGALVGGTGALAASGAFTSVEAERDVNIQTAGDDTALLGLEILSETLEGEDGDVISFDLEDDLNLQATTRFNDAFQITNNGDNDVDIDIFEGEVGDLGPSILDGDEAMNFEGSTTVSSGTSETYNIVFDLLDYNETSAANDELPDSIVIEATAQE